MCDEELEKLNDVKRRVIIFLWKAYLVKKRMGGFLDKPKTEKSQEHGQGNGLRFGVTSMQGWRVEMEDAHSALTDLPGELKGWSFFAVFDGHCGSLVSAHCSANLLPAITQTEEFRELEKVEDDNKVTIIRKAMHAGFLRLDEEMRKMPEVSTGEDRSGSTAVCALVSPTHLYIANCGDSRAVLCRAGNPAVCTEDHKPVNPGEKDRIQKAGGSVMIQRVNGSLAVSRSLGDYDYKNVEGKGPCEQLVSPEPEIFIEERHAEDEFLILACDGIWDVMSNADLCTFIREQLQITDDLEKVTSAVVDTCLFKGSRDNMSVVLVTFPAAPRPVPEVVERNKSVEQLLESKILDILKSEETSDINRIIQMLNEEDIPELDSVGGLGAKRSFIENLIHAHAPPVFEGSD